jgi:hypothetical protein
LNDLMDSAETTWSDTEIIRLLKKKWLFKTLRGLEIIYVYYL